MLMTTADPGPRRPCDRAAALHDDRGIVRRPRRVRAIDDPLGAGERAQRTGHRIPVDQVDVLAERIERERHRELRSDGVAIGPRVRAQDEPLASRSNAAATLVDSYPLPAFTLGGPSSARPAAALACLPPRSSVLALDLLEQFLDARLVRDRLIVTGRRSPARAEVQPLGKRPPDERQRALERPRRLLPFGRVAEHRVVNRAPAQIFGHLALASA